MDCGQMRDFSEFCEQLQEIRLKFHKWDSCERTVALYYLMAGLPFANAKFLQHALEQCIFAANTQEAQTLERKANDPTFINSFLAEHPQIALSLILTHLPLLRPGNSDGAKCYLKAIRKVLTEFITPPYKIYNECVEIMSYVFIHPAFNKEDKKSFKHLLKQVLHRVSPDNFIHSPVNESSDESVSPNPEPYVFNDRFDRRSNSLTAQASSQENLENLKPSHKPRSYSLSSEKSLLTTAPLQLSSSETRLQDLQMLNNQPEMKGIIAWLKSLRLHKYSWVFNNLTYEQMLNLNEEALQAIGITKGARHKILLSISKLKERSSLLTELETEVMNGADLNVALKKLKGVLQSPLQLNCEEDLPTQFVKVMGKVCTQLLMLRQPSDESFVLFNSLCDRAESLEAFSDEQKRRLIMWKGQLTNGAKLPIYRHQNSSSQGLECFLQLKTNKLAQAAQVNRAAEASSDSRHTQQWAASIRDGDCNHVETSILDLNKEYYEEGTCFQTKYKSINYTSWKEITCIIIQNVMTDGTGGSVYYSGGVGLKWANITLKSEESQGMRFRIKIYIK